MYIYICIHIFDCYLLMNFNVTYLYLRSYGEGHCLE